MKASYKPFKFPFNGKDMELNAGQFITGRNRALEELPDITAQTWRTSMNYLKSTNRITIKSTNRFSIISIINWNEYQQITSKLTNHQPATNQPLTTNKNVKNIRM